MSQFIIEDAVRDQAFLRLAICGPSGAGKTETMLRIAGGLQDAMSAMGKDLGDRPRKIGVLDTERKSASLYADLARVGSPVVKPFATIKMEAPYSPARYLEAVRAFCIQGYRIVGVDQMSHAWSGLGGLLEKKAELIAKEGYNSFDAFEVITPEQNRFVDALLSFDAHLIVTMRAKTAWVLEKYTKRGGGEGTRPKRIGMAPDQRQGTEYEFTSVLNLDCDGNVATVVKDRSGVFGPPGTVVGRLSEQHGLRLAQWLYEGRDFQVAAPDATPQEKLAALEATSVSSFQLARTVPDLVAAFAAAMTDLRGIDIGDFGKKGTQKALEAAKDKRKAELAPAVSAAPAPSGPVVTADQAVDLADYLGRCHVDRGALLEHFEARSLTSLPAECFHDAKDWIDAQVVLGTHRAA